MVLVKVNNTCKKMKLDHLPTPHTRINLKWIKNLNVILKTIKILHENTGSKISDIACSNFLLDVSPQARETTEKINKLQLHQTKNVLHSRENHQQNQKTTHRMGEHIHQYI